MTRHVALVRQALRGMMALYFVHTATRGIIHRVLV